MGFFISWIIFFMIVYRIAEVEFDNGDYPLLDGNLVLLLQTYRNSIGDIAPPLYSRWEEYMQSEDPA